MIQLSRSMVYDEDYSDECLSNDELNFDKYNGYKINITIPNNDLSIIFMIYTDYIL